MDQLMFIELAQLRDAVTTMSNTNFYCTTKVDVFIYTSIVCLEGAQFEDVGASLELFWERLIFLSF
jgi:hypothetical protein